jgi:hypothetical protein
MQEIAKQLEIHVSTLYRWRAEHPEFREALALGRHAADDRVEISLYHRAVGYTYPALRIIQQNGKSVVYEYMEHLPPDTSAAIFWLTNRRPQQWRVGRSGEAPVRQDEQSQKVVQAIVERFSRVQRERAEAVERIKRLKGAVDGQIVEG